MGVTSKQNCRFFLESLLVVKNIGLQIDVKYVVGNKFIFIPNDTVKDLFINEVISRVRTSLKFCAHCKLLFFFAA